MSMAQLQYTQNYHIQGKLAITAAAWSSTKFRLNGETIDLKPLQRIKIEHISDLIPLIHLELIGLHPMHRELSASLGEFVC